MGKINEKEKVLPQEKRDAIEILLRELWNEQEIAKVLNVPIEAVNEYLKENEWSQIMLEKVKSKGEIDIAKEIQKLKKSVGELTRFNFYLMRQIESIVMNAFEHAVFGKGHKYWFVCPRCGKATYITKINGKYVCIQCKKFPFTYKRW